MGKEKYNIDEEIDKTLDMVNHIQQVEGNPFLLTRIEEKIRQEERSNSRALSWQWALTMALVIMNATAVFLYVNDSNMDEYSMMQSEYSWVDSSDVDLFTLD